MKKTFLPIVVWLFLFLVAAVSSPAQRTRQYDDPQASFSLAMDLFNKEKYVAAQEVFGKVIMAIADPYAVTRIHAAYYHALCAYELYHKDATDLYTDFIRMYPENTMAQLAQFQLAKLRYRNKEYRAALDAFKKTDIRQLNPEEKNEYYFKPGYCYLKENNLPMAEQSFQKILNAESRYQGPANYYYAHIAYQKNDLDKALEGFERLSEDETFKEVVPLYILQIKFKQQKYDEVIGLGNQLAVEMDDRKNADIVRMVGESYFKTSHFQEALPLLEKYSKTSGGHMTEQDWYQLGYAFYREGNYLQAIQAFQKTTGTPDSLSQNAYYHLGDCYVRTNQKQFGQSAFLSAYKMDFNKAIREDALFNYAKLAYELSYDPYNEAIRALRQYSTDYPGSSRIDEANLYLANLFLSTSNYREALETIDKIRNKDEQTKRAYQKTAHYRGIELFNTRDYPGAVALFKKSLDFPLDRDIHAANFYWMAESYYRMGSFDFAIEHYKEFLSQQAAPHTPFFALTSYNLGYAYYNQKNYAPAAEYFKKFTSAGYADAQFMNDAYLRLGDCSFVNKSYDEAIGYYDQALVKKTSGSDYALLQKALAFGGKGDFEQKAALLKEFLSAYPRSTFTEEVLYELAVTCTLLNRDDEALGYFKKIPQDYPSGKYIKKALLKSGLIYYTKGGNDLSITTLKKVIADYPGSEESREALEIIRNIYVDMNRVNEYLSYAQTLPFADLSVMSQDSLSYFTAEDRYMKGDCAGAIQGFTGYIDRFPQGSFLTQAHFYRSECELKNRDPEAALEGYTFVLQQPPTQFTENALLRVAAITYESGDLPRALETFQKLEEAAGTKSAYLTALTGQMRCHYRLKDFGKATAAAEKVLGSEITEPGLEAEANFILGKSALATGNSDRALKAFRRTCELVQDERAAESQYLIAWITLENKAFQDAEKAAFELINRYPSYDYWVAKGFILLSDSYVGTGNTFQAKQTLQSIIDNYPGEDLRKEAASKLNAILTLEKASQSQTLPEEEPDQDKF